MKKAWMNISYFPFILFNLKIFGEIVTRFFESVEFQPFLNQLNSKQIFLIPWAIDTLQNLSWLHLGTTLDLKSLLFARTTVISTNSLPRLTHLRVVYLQA